MDFRKVAAATAVAGLEHAGAKQKNKKRQHVMPCPIAVFHQDMMMRAMRLRDDGPSLVRYT